MSYPQYAIGTSYPPQSFASFDPPLPWPLKSTPEKYPVTFPRGDGTTAGHGFPSTTILFQFLEQAELNHLLGLLTVGGVLRKSRAGIYVRTLTPEDQSVFADYTGILHLPENLHEYRQPGGYYAGVPFPVTRLEPYSP